MKLNKVRQKLYIKQSKKINISKSYESKAKYIEIEKSRLDDKVIVMSSYMKNYNKLK